MKPLAPYGEYSSTNFEYLSIIFMGEHSFEHANNLKENDLFPFTMCLPPNKSPFDFKWPIYDREIYLLDTSQSKLSFIQFCALCFFSYGAKKITYISKKLCSVIEKGVSCG